VSAPAFDTAEDVLVSGTIPLSTLMENSPPLTLGLVVLPAPAWLAAPTGRRFCRAAAGP
jgi:hypothetical protein